MSSGFITEAEILEARQKRQDEWEKVRTADQPLELPEEPYDGRPLYERLREEKMKKDEEFEEAHKLKNLIRGLDDDEVQFLDQVDKTKLKAEKQQHLEEEKELREFRERVATLQEKSIDDKLQMEMSKPKTKPSLINSSRQSQRCLLGAVVLKKRKNGDDTMLANKIMKTEKEINANDSQQDDNTVRKSLNMKTITTNEMNKGQLKCVAILPGIGRYKDSSDSEISSGSEEEPDYGGVYDLFGRKRVHKAKCGKDSE